MIEQRGLAIAEVTALVTGANRGLGRTFTQELLHRGAARVYAASREPGSIGVTDERAIPIRPDITHPDNITSVAAQCLDMSLLINNAGVMPMDR